MTPLIDVLLVLLIIFMLLVPTPSHGLDSELPQQNALPSAERLDMSPLELRVGQSVDGLHYALNGAPIAFSELRARLQSELALRSERVVFVRGDASLLFQPVAAAVSVAHQAGAQHILLKTRGEL